LPRSLSSRESRLREMDTSCSPRCSRIVLRVGDREHRGKGVGCAQIVFHVSEMILMEFICNACRFKMTKTKSAKGALNNIKALGDGERTRCLDPERVKRQPPPQCCYRLAVGKVTPAYGDQQFGSNFNHRRPATSLLAGRCTSK